VIGLVIVGQGVFAVAVIAAILLASRVLLAWVGANPFSWLSYNLTRVTEPIVRPFKHPLSGRIPRYDLVPLVAAVLVLMNGLFIMGLLRQLAEILGRLGGDILTGNATAAVVVSELIRLTGWVLVALIFLRFLLPFLGVSYASRFMRLLYKLTEPVLRGLSGLDSNRVGGRHRGVDSSMNHGINFRETDAGVTFNLIVQPKAQRTEIAGTHGGAVKLRIAAAPVDGKANEECVRFLSKMLGVPRTSVRILKGSASRRKAICISNVNARQVVQGLGLER
jgi:uncharacterized protein (TIGR00251 family)